MTRNLTAEHRRLEEARDHKSHWKRWGPYLSERAWGTVREDYSAHGTAWEYVPHDHARSRAYRWNEDGLAGISDRHQKICFALALWNGRDPILKERMFGLAGNEGNHGEDCKECYFYLDSTPTHSYMKYLYKYPQAAFPYQQLVEENRRRGREEREFELIDTGVFNENRYFDAFVEYAKASPDDILIKVTVANRGPDAAELRLLPTVWFRNTWSWSNGAPRPELRAISDNTIEMEESQYNKRWLVCEGAPELLFTENETNTLRLYGYEGGPRLPKDGINDYVVHGAADAVNDTRVGTKASALYKPTIPAGETTTVRLRLTDAPRDASKLLGRAFDRVFADRRKEADEVYAAVIPQHLSEDAQRIFHKLLLNFTWWVNRKDAEGRNVFQGGFLGLDNIGVFDRSAPLPTGGHLEQADGTGWMAMYSLNLLAIALELAREDPSYEDVASKFWEHFLYIANAINHLGNDGVGMWDEQDGFFYDVLHSPGDGHIPLKIRSMVGLIPLYAVETLEPEIVDRLPGFKRRLEWFIENRRDLTANVACMKTRGCAERRLISIVNPDQLRRVLRFMPDENEFLSPYGLRALSRVHKDQPYRLPVNGMEYRVDYEPAESSTGLFGGNSNWRGRIWFPVNYLPIESLQKFSQELSRRLTRIFLKDHQGLRPVHRANRPYQDDPHWRDLVLFYEYFHGDDGSGVGASHQTGWTGVVAKLLQQSGDGDGEPQFLSWLTVSRVLRRLPRPPSQTWKTFLHNHLGQMVPLDFFNSADHHDEGVVCVRHP